MTAMYTYLHAFSPLYSPYGPSLMFAFLPLIALVALGSVVLKGYALWHAARARQTRWFIALLVLNTLGILEIIYLIWYRPKPDTLQKPADAASSATAT